MSIIEVSHRSKEFAVALLAEKNLRKLLNIPDNYHKIATKEVPIAIFNDTHEPFKRDSTVDYAVTGSWGKKAVAEAKNLQKLILYAILRFKLHLSSMRMDKGEEALCLYYFK